MQDAYYHLLEQIFLEQIFLEQKYQLNAQSAQITISSTLSSQSQRQYSQKGDYNLLQTVLMLVGR